MKFSYIGDQKIDPKTGRPLGPHASGYCVMGGITFPFAEFVEVEDERLISKLKINSHFVEDDSEQEKPERKKPGPKPKVVESE